MLSRSRSVLMASRGIRLRLVIGRSGSLKIRSVIGALRPLAVASRELDRRSRRLVVLQSSRSRARTARWVVVVETCDSPVVALAVAAIIVLRRRYSSYGNRVRRTSSGVEAREKFSTLT